MPNNLVIKHRTGETQVFAPLTLKLLAVDAHGIPTLFQRVKQITRDGVFCLAYLPEKFLQPNPQRTKKMSTAPPTLTPDQIATITADDTALQNDLTALVSASQGLASAQSNVAAANAALVTAQSTYNSAFGQLGTDAAKLSSDLFSAGLTAPPLDPNAQGG